MNKIHFPGHFGDPLALPHGNCDQCSCYPRGTEQTDKGISICDPNNGNYSFFMRISVFYSLQFQETVNVSPM